MNVWRDNSTLEAQPWEPPAGSRLAAASLVKQRFPMLGTALQATVVPLELSFAGLDGVIGWGGRIQARIARRYAMARKLRYWAVEDGFLRSVGLGKARSQALSITVDDLGLHHDPRSQSRLERLILEGAAPLDIDYARQVRARLLEERLTKYNCDGDDACRLPRAKRSRRILLVDQVAHDASIAAYSGSAFHRMWSDALDQDAEILVRDHPDVVAGYSRGVLRGIVRMSNRAILDGAGALHHLLPEVDEVWTVSSQLGFEALMHGKRVMTYGMPFYAGWGATEDRATDRASLAARGRRSRRIAGVDELVAAALVRYPIYHDPIEEKRVTIEKAMDRLALWRREAGRVKGRYICVGFSRHKHRTARLFLGTPWSTVSFSSRSPSDRRAGAGANHVTWGRRDHADSLRPQVTIEDGFIRSVGLGSQLVRPRSLCIDPVGIYYDATRPSLLETILTETAFDDALLDRAQRLRRLIVYSNISKYNVSSERFDAKSLRTDRPIVLVAEQMPDDASLRYGQAAHSSSLELLAAVRKARPEHFILFKRHPDIVSGARRGGSSALDYCRYADYVLERKIELSWSGIAECHSATSQLGFEALLRGVATFCHGAPFYSSWGLTTDSIRIPRRTRRLTIDQLVAGALILYPSYRCWKSYLPCEPEDVIRDIISERHVNQDWTNLLRNRS